MKKNLFLLKSNLSQLGGAEKMALRLASAFGKKDHTVTILTTGETTSVTETHATILSAQNVPKISVFKVKAFDRFCTEHLEKRKSAIVFGLDHNRFQTHLRASNGVHAAYLKKRSLQEGLFKALSLRFNPLHATLLKLEKMAFEHPELEKLYTNSAMVRAEILEHYNVAPEKIKVVHNGVEWNEMDPDFQAWPEQRLEILKKLNLPASRHHFLFIGHNYQRKGLDPLLRGLSLLPNRDFHLSVVGKEKNGNEFAELAEILGIANNVSFFGPQKEIRSFYQLADTLVIPSFYDPFANVTVEALAMGVFVVSSKTNGGFEILTEATGAVIEELADPEAMAHALLQALKRPKTLTSAALIRSSVRFLDFSQQMTYFLEDL